MKDQESIRAMRRVYQLQSLNEEDVHKNAMEQFDMWWKQAVDGQIEEPNAMVLSTCGSAGYPASRVVLLKGLEPSGFVFFTNYESDKGHQIQENNRVSLLFFWQALERQVRIVGNAEKVPLQVSDAYFASRPRESQIGAWSSPQSKVVESRYALQQKENYFTDYYRGETVPRPPHWGGYLVKPVSIEFWQGRPGRLHDRLLYTLQGEKWTIKRLAP